MFDFDAGKLLIIGVVALIVIGPKELPRVLRQVGQAVGRLRRMASDFQGQFMEAMKEADLQDIRDEVSKLGSQADLNVHFDPAREVQKELTQALTPSVSVAPELSVAPPTSTFELPHLPEVPPEVEATTAASGYAPAVQEGASLDPAPSRAGPKRKIALPKRRPQPSNHARLDVSTRTGVRFRTVRPRRDEATEQ